jgi:hypothetical protein
LAEQAEQPASERLAQKRWQRASKEDVGRAVVELCDALENEQKGRKTRCLEALSRYEMRRIRSLTAGAYYTAGSMEVGDGDNAVPLRWATERSLANTAQAKIAGRQRPKSQFVTSDADWETKRKAQKLDRCVEATMLRPQGAYADFWEVSQRVFLDSCIFPAACAMKFTPDVENERVCIDRVLPWEVFVDALEAQNGNPLSLFHIYPYDRDSLAAQYPGDADQEAIYRAAEYEDELTRNVAGTTRVADQIKVREAWRLPLSKNMPGRHVVAIDGPNGGHVLLDEPWKRQEFPFIFLRWAWEVLGFGAVSLVEEVMPICDEVNESIARCQSVVKRTSQSVCIYDEGSVREEDLLTNEDAINIRKTPGANPVQWFSPSPLNEQVLEWVQLNDRKAYEISGISQMSATSRKEQGVTAGVAIRTLADMETERFAVVFKKYETACAVEAARQIVAANDNIGDEKKDYTLRWRGEGSLRSYRWNDVKLPIDAYDVYPVSGLKNTPTDRLQLAQELNASGKLSDDALLRVIEYLDTKQEVDKAGKQRQLIERYIDDWLDATPQKQQDGSFRFKAPIPWMPSLEDAMVQVAEAYLDAQLDGIPTFNEQFFLTFMQQLDNEITKKGLRAAQIAQGIDPGSQDAVAPAPGGPAMPGAGAPPMPPGAPPGPMPMPAGGPPMPAAA